MSRKDTNGHGSLKTEAGAGTARLRPWEQHLQSGLHRLYRVRTILVQPLPMGNELPRLPREQKILRGLVPPRCYSLQRGRSIERAVDLGGRKLSSVPAKPLGFCHVRRGRTDPASHHRSSPRYRSTPCSSVLHLSAATHCARRRPPRPFRYLSFSAMLRCSLRIGEHFAGPGFQLGIRSPLFE